jgi:hypothetical protein
MKKIKKNQVRAIVVSPKTRRPPIVKNYWINKDGVSISLDDDRRVVLSGAMSYGGPTFIVNGDNGVLVDIDDDGGTLRIDGRILEQYARDKSAEQINQTDIGLSAVLMRALPWLVVVLIMLVMPVTFLVVKNGLSG